MVGKYPVITLCGSTRFKEQFLEAQKRLTLEGNIVISVGLFGHSGDDEVWTEGTKEMLDDMHKRKIDMADSIYVINVGGYIGSSTRSEIEYAKDLSEHFKSKHYSKVISGDEFFDILPTVQYHMDEPLADPSAVALYFVSNTAAEHVKVALSGEGADEFFGGYNIYHEPFSLSGYQKLPLGLRRGLASCARALPFNFKGKNFLIRGSKSVEERFIGNAFMFNEEERSKILKAPTGKYDHKELTAPFYKKQVASDDVTRMQYIDTNFWLIGDILLKADKMSMANSLEVRVPFLDRKVFDLARTLPTRFKVNDQNTTVAMRAAAHRHLPDFVAEKKKLGFPVPIRIWLKEDKYYGIIKAAFTSKAAEKFFNTSEIVRLLDEHRSGKVDNSRKVWTIYLFLVWYKEFFE